jgi:hypothetical protein
VHGLFFLQAQSIATFAGAANLLGGRERKVARGKKEIEKKFFICYIRFLKSQKEKKHED